MMKQKKTNVACWFIYESIPYSSHQLNVATSDLQEISWLLPWIQDHISEMPTMKDWKLPDDVSGVILSADANFNNGHVNLQRWHDLSLTINTG